jgi:hypothetical protein
MSAFPFADTLIQRTRGFASQARSYADTTAEAARESAVRLATMIEGLEAPVRTLSTAGTGATAVSQRFVADLLAVQAETVEAALEDGAARLRMAASAPGFRSIVKKQVEELPASGKRIKSNLRKAADATARAGRDLRALATSTYGDLIAQTKGAANASVKRRKSPARKAKAPSAARKTTRTTKAKTTRGRRKAA